MPGDVAPERVLPRWASVEVNEHRFMRRLRLLGRSDDASWGGRDLKQVGSGFIVPDTERHVEIRTERDRARLDGPLALVTTPWALLERDVDNRVLWGAEIGLNRAGWRAVRDRPRTRTEHDDLAVHLRVPKAAELGALHGVGSGPGSLDPEDVRPSWNRVNLDSQVGDVERVVHIIGTNEKQECDALLDVHRPRGLGDGCVRAIREYEGARIVEPPRPLGPDDLDCIIVVRGPLDERNRDPRDRNDRRENENGSHRPAEFEPPIVGSGVPLRGSPARRVLVPLHRREDDDMDEHADDQGEDQDYEKELQDSLLDRGRGIRGRDGRGEAQGRKNHRKGDQNAGGPQAPETPQSGFR